MIAMLALALTSRYICLNMRIDERGRSEVGADLLIDEVSHIEEPGITFYVALE